MFAHNLPETMLQTFTRWVKGLVPLVAVVATFGGFGPVLGQTPGTPLPGMVGPWKPSSPISPCFQPVEFNGPAGVTVAPAIDGAFAEPQKVPMRIGLLVHPVYRFCVSGIQGEEGRELFPTLELLDGLCPPPGEEQRFAIPIELTEDDLRLALAGHFVTRVIYVEDPEKAIPVVGDAEHQNWFDVGPGVDPLREAKQYGRPIAILRMGGIVPDNREGPSPQFLIGSPPVLLLPPPRPAQPAGQAPAAPTKIVLQPVAPAVDGQERKLR